MSRESFQHDDSRFFNDDPYVVLGLSRGATKKDVDEAIVKLQRRFHPDISKHPKALEISQKINAAYDALVKTDRGQGLRTTSERSGNFEQREVRVSTRVLRNVKTDRGSWQERKQQGHYTYFDREIAKVPEFEPKETDSVDIMLVQFGKSMTSEEVKAWLAEQKEERPEEYGDYELARPEHLDDLLADSRAMAELPTAVQALCVVALGTFTSTGPWGWGPQLVGQLFVWDPSNSRSLGVERDFGNPWSGGTTFALVRKSK